MPLTKLYSFSTDKNSPLDLSRVCQENANTKHVLFLCSKSFSNTLAIIPLSILPNTPIRVGCRVYDKTLGYPRAYCMRLDPAISSDLPFFVVAQGHPTHPAFRFLALFSHAAIDDLLSEITELRSRSCTSKKESFIVFRGQ